MDKGIYCLVLKNPACTVRVGALGPLPFAAGWHCYIGSALGPGGLVRLERHTRLAEHRRTSGRSGTSITCSPIPGLRSHMP